MGESDLPDCGLPASFSVHMTSIVVTPTGSVSSLCSDLPGTEGVSACLVISEDDTEGEGKMVLAGYNWGTTDILWKDKTF